MYSSKAEFTLDPYYISPRANLIRSKYWHTTDKFDYHEDRFYSVPEGRDIRVFPESHTDNDPYKYEMVKKGDKSIELPITVKNENGRAMCIFHDFDIKVENHLTVECHKRCRNVYGRYMNDYTLKQTAYCPRYVYAAFIIQKKWRQKKGYTFKEPILSNKEEHMLDLKGMIMYQRFQKLNKYDHELNESMFWYNWFMLDLINKDGIMYIRSRFRKIKFYREVVFEREYHSMIDVCRHKGRCWLHTHRNKNYEINMYDLYFKQSAYCAKYIGSAYKIQRRWRIYQKRKILWKIAEYYMAKKYAPENVLNFIDLYD